MSAALARRVGDQLVRDSFWRVRSSFRSACRSTTRSGSSCAREVWGFCWATLNNTSSQSTLYQYGLCSSQWGLSLRYRTPFFLVLLACTAIPAFSQDSIRANVRGDNRSDQGKCTIEVDVDDVAEVQVRGDTARVRTLSGGPARFRRFDCDSIMPTRPNEFRFTGVDGRGRVTLVQDPRNGGVAVVRIEDPKGGREGYTFDLEWRGGSVAVTAAAGATATAMVPGVVTVIGAMTVTTTATETATGADAVIRTRTQSPALRKTAGVNIARQT